MWDGDPVSLHPHPPVESAKRFVDLIGADKILAEGQRAFDAADYRWAVEILHKLVFADPDNTAARELQADAYEQMGYQVEGPQWRGIFLTAATELREGVSRRRVRHRQPRHHPGHADRHPLRLRRRPRHRRARPPTSTSASTSPSPTSTRPGRCGCAAACSTRGRGARRRAADRHRAQGRARGAVLLKPAPSERSCDAGAITLDGDAIGAEHLRRCPRRVRSELRHRHALRRTPVAVTVYGGRSRAHRVLPEPETQTQANCSPAAHVSAGFSLATGMSDPDRSVWGERHGRSARRW